MRRFVKDQGMGILLKAVEMLPAVFAVGREKALKRESGGDKPADAKGAYRGARAGNNDGPDAGRRRKTDDVLARVGDAGHSGVRNDRDIFSVLHPFDDRFPAFAKVVLMVADERLFDVEIIEQL